MFNNFSQQNTLKFKFLFILVFVFDKMFYYADIKSVMILDFVDLFIFLQPSVAPFQCFH